MWLVKAEIFLQHLHSNAQICSWHSALGWSEETSWYCQLGQKIIVFTAHSLLSPQVALAIIISPHAFNDSLVHDSYLCKVDILMKGSLNLPFPTQRISGKNFTMPKPGTNIIEPFAFLARYIIDYPIWKIVDDSQIRDVLYQKCMKTVSIYSWKEAVKKFCNTGSSWA